MNTSPSAAGMRPEVMLSIAISVATPLLLLIGWFIVRTLKQVEDAIQAGKSETTALRSELSTVKSDLKEYAGQVQRQSEELGSLKKAYSALERAFNAMDKWLYGQAMQGKLPQPPDFRATPIPE
jgi:type II secretory pathway component PulJ